MTERSEPERAELEALADLIDNATGVEVCTFDPMRLEHKRTQLSDDDIARLGSGLAALRRLAAQNQKPVAWLQSSGTKTIVSQQRLDMDASRYGWTEKPLYLSPPPSAGWDAAIEACKKVAEKWLESFMGGEAYVARSIVNAIEALRTTPAATKSADVTEAAGYAERLAVALWEKHGKTKAPHWKPLSGDLIGILTQIDNMTCGLVPDHGGADAGVRVKPLEWDEASILRLFKERWPHVDLTEDRDAWGRRKLMYPHVQSIYAGFKDAIEALSHQPAPVAANASAELSKFANDLAAKQEPLGVQISAEDLESIYIRDEPLANASAEARLRGVLEAVRFNLIHFANYKTDSVLIEGIDKALSTHPLANDCDKQGETTKSEGGEGSPQDGKVGGSEQPYSAGTRQGREIPQSSKPKAECAGSISAAPLPSDRTADVTGYLPIHECYETGDDEVTVVELKTFLDKQWPAPHGDVARALLDAFTVGRR